MRRPRGSSKSAARAAAEALFAGPWAKATASAATIALPERQMTRETTGREHARLGHDGLVKDRTAQSGKTWCRDADVFIGPEYGRLRVWHRHPSRDAEPGRRGHPSHRETLAEIFPEALGADPVKLRMALRKERRAGRSGALGYSIERHAALASALAACRGHLAVSRCRLS